MTNAEIKRTCVIQTEDGREYDVIVGNFDWLSLPHLDTVKVKYERPIIVLETQQSFEDALSGLSKQAAFNRLGYTGASLLGIDPWTAPMTEGEKTAVSLLETAFASVDEARESQRLKIAQGR